MEKQFLNSNRQVITYFIRLVHKLTPQYIPALVLQSIFKTLRPLVFIFGPKLIVDELTNLQRVEYMVGLIAMIAISNFILTSGERWFEYKTQYYTQLFNNAFERYIAKKTAEIDYYNIEDPDILDLKERALFAIRNHWLMGSMIMALSSVTNEGILLLSLIGIIWTFSPWILLLLIGVVLVNSFLFRKVQEYYYFESTETVGNNRSFVYFLRQSADLEIAKDVRLYNMTDLILSKMNRTNLLIYKTYLRVYSAISRLNGFVSVNVQIQTVITYFLLARRTLAGSVTLGNFMMYAGSIGKLGTSMNQFVSSIIEVNRLCRQLELLVEYEKIPRSHEQGDQPISEDCKYEIKFENVSFKYPRADDYTLKDLNVTIRQGEKISIIGKNGAGKTTFVKLLTRLYKPTEGVITLDGVDIQDLDYETYMSKVAAVFQDYRLFGITVEENITGKDSNEYSYNIEHIIKEVGMEEDVSKLQYGAKTALDKGYDKEATKLSGGQSQKLAIARALYKDAEIVVLDEPTAALDPLAEHDVYQRFDELVQGKTAIYISHRLSSCRFCDSILVFENGHIIERGSHDELITIKDSAYAELFNAQAEYYSA
ncbi:ABC transporter ATP-binding protein [Acidaminobacter sp. JC074]|uniref:ABC transporter ATP-binding protein n=1 Tax=Acidaminobacter sp. JC074 TaxID=2530199 RepID=UPI001F0D5EA2|nr:ABC transporter ATP-binding protein [Acidaminobacter sp. JC074]MCH4887876.1 ABC transporter ATP-binding protein [Acidaminobacter sp. JC074]